MKPALTIVPLLFFLILSATPSVAQRAASPNDNAALRYWSAFSVMQDSAITADQAAELNAVLAGRAEYDDSKFAAVVEKNKLPLEIMARATTLPDCDWGLDDSFGGDEPVEYARNALALGRLNVLYALHLLNTGDTEAGVNTIVAGLYFSRDVANGGTLFATLVADQLITEHLRVVTFAARTANLSAPQRLKLNNAVARLGPDGLDWRSAIDREFQVTRTHFPGNAQAAAAVLRIDEAYVKALQNPSALTEVSEAIHAAPPAVARLIPLPRRVVEDKQALTTEISQARTLLK
ncbi:MAG: hypothetical protein ACRD8A_11765 [Candidatus Acidiferrales bacterium]